MGARISDESHLSLSFDCSNSIERVPLCAAPWALAAERLLGTVSRVANGRLQVSPENSCLIFNFQGAVILRPGQSKIAIVPPRSIVFLRAGQSMAINAARGEHEALAIRWHVAAHPILERLIEESSVGGQKDRMVAVRAIDPSFIGLEARAKSACNHGGGQAESIFMSVVYEALPYLLQSDNEFLLASLPPDLPEILRDLVEKVRDKPNGNWALKDASDYAGYSPFHFSRVFKASVGYGFHEYVDRCRTESAVKLLTTTEMPVDLVASNCGFGTTQGLRESVKEYLGLVPSELRGSLENAD
jgi:AraC-like DNA-binding protein